MNKFWKKVNKNGTIPEFRPELGPCWQWLDSLIPYGYGKFWDTKRSWPAHKFSYESTYGPIKPPLVIDHLCRNRGCVNPKHLEAVTHRENNNRGFGPSALNARKTHCNRGHEFTTGNTFRTKLGQRGCRKCAVLNTQKSLKKLEGTVWSRMTPEQKRKSLERKEKWRKENEYTGRTNRKKTHCIHGHTLKDAFIKKNGKRECRECNRIRCKKRRLYHDLPLI